MDTLRDRARENKSAWSSRSPSIARRQRQFPPSAHGRLEGLGVAVPNVQEGTLRQVIEQHPVIGLILAHKEATSASPPMAMGISLRFTGDPPHSCRLPPDRGRDGRMACARPNLQNIPRDPAYRACIRPAPGRVLVKADLALIELCVRPNSRAMSGCSKPSPPERTFTASPLRPFSTKSVDAVTKEERAFGKTVNFGTLYGQGLRGLIEAAHKHGLSLSDPEARSVQQRFAAAWPDLTTWKERQMRDAAVFCGCHPGGCDGSMPMRPARYA